MEKLRIGIEVALSNWVEIRGADMVDLIARRTKQPGSVLYICRVHKRRAQPDVYDSKEHGPCPVSASLASLRVVTCAQPSSERLVFENLSW